MKEQKNIPTDKIRRASRILGSGMKVGGNYLKHYTKKIFTDVDRENLDKANAEEIYNTLSELKGGALKIAQMMSMNDALPQAYTDKFALAQYNAPPLSYPLIVKTFKQDFGKTPSEIFDNFSREADNAASIGQVHFAEKEGKKLAVKIRYPGVAESLKSDIKMVKPFALRLMNITKDELEYYVSEVESMLEKETDYKGELERSISIGNACRHLDNVIFPRYYRELSSKQVITMDKIEGTLLNDFIKMKPSQKLRNKIGQAIWDFYLYQMHTLRVFHADAHPGNFIVTDDEKCGIIDFGAVKEMTDEVYLPYFKLVLLDFEKDADELSQIFTRLKIVLPTDSEDEKELFTGMFTELLSVVKQPFETKTFNFGETRILDKMFELGQKYGHDKRVRKANSARGLRDTIYLNRTFFGLYSILTKLEAEIETNRGEGFVYNGI